MYFGIYSYSLQKWFFRTAQASEKLFQEYKKKKIDYCSDSLEGQLSLILRNLALNRRYESGKNMVCLQMLFKDVIHNFFWNYFLLFAFYFFPYTIWKNRLFYIYYVTHMFVSWKFSDCVHFEITEKVMTKLCFFFLFFVVMM